MKLPPCLSLGNTDGRVEDVNGSPATGSTTRVPRQSHVETQCDNSVSTARGHHVQWSASPWSAETFENAVLESLHTSTTDSILQWPHFDAFSSLRTNALTNFELERARPAMRVRSGMGHPYVSEDRLRSILDKFAHGVNFWFPTLAERHYYRMPAMLSADSIVDGDDGETCLALLTMALGCAGEVSGGLAEQVELSDEDVARRSQSKVLGDMYFNAALRRLYAAHAEISPTAAHCLLFTA